MTPTDLAEVLRLHKLWVEDEPEGVQADLSCKDLRNADLSCKDLRNADLRNADLRGADLTDADLRNASLRGAYLSGADLRGVDLRGVDLHAATLHAATLHGADLRAANLRGAILPHHPLPDTGNLIVYKKVAGGVILRLWVPATAARTCCVQSRKCRVEYAVVLYGSDGGAAWDSARFGNAKPLRYVRGELVRPDSYDPDVRVECTHGIHVYATRREAEES